MYNARQYSHVLLVYRHQCSSLGVRVIPPHISSNTNNSLECSTTLDKTSPVLLNLLFCCFVKPLEIRLRAGYFQSYPLSGRLQFFYPFVYYLLLFRNLVDRTHIFPLPSFVIVQINIITQWDFHRQTFCSRLLQKMLIVLRFYAMHPQVPTMTVSRDFFLGEGCKNTRYQFYLIF